MNKDAELLVLLLDGLAVGGMLDAEDGVPVGGVVGEFLCGTKVNAEGGKHPRDAAQGGWDRGISPRELM